MATETQDATTDLVLTPPDPVPVVAPEKAVGLVPVDDSKRTQLQARVETFIDDLVAQDVNSPEFGKRVDAISAMGQKEIREAAGQSNRFLDRPVKAMNQESGVGADLAELRRTIEDLDPGKQGSLLAPKKLFGIIPFGNKMRDYFDGYKSSQTHIATILKSLGSGKDELLMDNAAIDVERANLWQRDGAARADDPAVQDDGRAARGQGQRARPHRSGQGQGDPRGARSSMSASAPRTC